MADSAQKRTKRVAAISIFVAFVIVVLVGGLWLTADPDGDPAVDGTLSNDIVAIGGETTGWGITPVKRGRVFTEVDVSAVSNKAASLCGKRVKAWGTVQTRDGVERSYQVLVVNRLEPY